MTPLHTLHTCHAVKMYEFSKIRVKIADGVRTLKLAALIIMMMCVCVCVYYGEIFLLLLGVQKYVCRVGVQHVDEFANVLFVMKRLCGYGLQTRGSAFKWKITL